MTVALLDVNVLMALAWPNHLHHEMAHAWFQFQRSRGWATCTVTQMGFVRLSTQPAVVKTTIAGSDAVSILESNVSAAEHEFWPLEHPFHEMEGEIRQRLLGHRQVQDAALLDLAIRKGGCLATFDRGIESLLATDSEYCSALVVLPVE